MSLTNRQKSALRNLLTNIRSWTSARYDQHLRHDVGDKEAEAIMAWLDREIMAWLDRELAEGPPAPAVDLGGVEVAAFVGALAGAAIGPAVRPHIEAHLARPTKKLKPKKH